MDAFDDKDLASVKRRIHRALSRGIFDEECAKIADPNSEIFKMQAIRAGRFDLVDFDTLDKSQTKWMRQVERYSTISMMQTLYDQGFAIFNVNNEVVSHRPEHVKWLAERGAAISEGWICEIAKHKWLFDWYITRYLITDNGFVNLALSNNMDRIYQLLDMNKQWNNRYLWQMPVHVSTVAQLQELLDLNCTMDMEEALIDTLWDVNVQHELIEYFIELIGDVSDNRHKLFADQKRECSTSSIMRQISKDM